MCYPNTILGKLWNVGARSYYFWLKVFSAICWSKGFPSFLFLYILVFVCSIGCERSVLNWYWKMPPNKDIFNEISFSDEEVSNEIVKGKSSENGSTVRKFLLGVVNKKMEFVGMGNKLILNLSRLHP